METKLQTALNDPFNPSNYSQSTKHPGLRGLGDVVALFAQPVARAVDAVLKTDIKNCPSCKNRQNKLNTAFPMKAVVRNHPNLVKPAVYPTASARRTVPKPYVSQKPRPFSIFETNHDRAIICPWLYVEEAWDELRWSLRSIDKFFADKECPIYVMGNQAPKWLKPGERVQFVKIDEYAKSREDGLWMAWQKGLQIAEKVIWTNDDIYLLKKTDWEDFEVALTEGTLDESEEAFRASGNIWMRYLGDACAELRKRGHKPVWRFATHTPYLFEREKSLEIMKEYHIPFKGALETIYYNHHGTPHEPCDPHKVRKLPCSGSPRYLNNGGAGPDAGTQRELQRILSTKPPWEK